MIDKAILDQFIALLPPANVLVEKHDIAPFLKEWRDAYQGVCPLILLPDSTEQLGQIVRLANQTGTKLRVQGGNTGLVGGQIPQGEILISLKKMNKIIAVNAQDDVIIAQSGAILADVHTAAASINRRLPLSLASEGSATIGGLMSTNAGGVHVRRHGMMRQQVLGLEAVMADGKIFSGLTQLRKDNTGLDIKHWLIGAEGTLGIITAASLALKPIAPVTLTGFVGFHEPDQALALLRDLESSGFDVAACEIINAPALALTLANVPNVRDPLADCDANWRALIEVEGKSAAIGPELENALMGAIENGQIDGAVLAQNQAQAKAMWQIRESISAAQKPEGKAVKLDISVPVSAIGAFLTAADDKTQALYPNARIIAFGHASDGNIHYDILAPKEDGNMKPEMVALLMEKIHDIAVDMGGSISAEHGIGLARRDEFMAREPTDHLALMRTIKAALDPNSILNMGVMIQ